MALTYDFDIFAVIPESGASDPLLDGFLTRVGFRSRPEMATVALFRDPRTAEALRNAPPGLRDFFLESGFGLNTYSSGVPRGRYPAKDEAARLDLIRRLTENARLHILPRPEDCSETGEVFRLGEFLAELDRSEPIGSSEDVALVHDHSARQIGPRRHDMPPVFETDPFAEPPPVAEVPTRRRKFWQNRYFRIGAVAGLVLGALQLASGPAATVLASL